MNFFLSVDWNAQRRIYWYGEKFKGTNCTLRKPKERVGKGKS